MSEQDRNKLLEYLREQLNSDDTSEDTKGALEALIDSLERQKHTD
jgi:DNA-directed RNA polymerase specialized sigma54-like protein